MLSGGDASPHHRITFPGDLWMTSVCDCDVTRLHGLLNLNATYAGRITNYQLCDVLRPPVPDVVRKNAARQPRHS